MGSYAYLKIEKEELFSWKGDMPAENDVLLSYIFEENDKHIFQDKDIELDDKDNYTCTYKTRLSIVKERFTKLHLTTREIDNCIANIALIKKEHVGLALMDYDSFYDKYLSGHYNKYGELYKKQAELSELKAELNEKLDNTELGLLPTLRYIRTELDRRKTDDYISLDFGDFSVYGKKEEIEKFTFFSNNYDNTHIISRQRIDTAKVHFSNYNFDMVYIDLIIALEDCIRNFIKNKVLDYKKTYASLNIEKILKEISFMNQIKYIMIFLNKEQRYTDLLMSVEQIYNRRNNIIHGGARNFKRLDTANAIEDVRKIITILSK